MLREERRGCSGRLPSQVRLCFWQAGSSATAMCRGHRCGRLPRLPKLFRPVARDGVRTARCLPSVEELLKLAESRAAERPAHAFARIYRRGRFANGELKTGDRFDVVALLVKDVDR